MHKDFFTFTHTQTHTHTHSLPLPVSLCLSLHSLTRLHTDTHQHAQLCNHESKVCTEPQFSWAEKTVEGHKDVPNAFEMRAGAERRGRLDLGHFESFTA